MREDAPLLTLMDEATGLPKLSEGWTLSWSGDPLALDVVDGCGRFKVYGPHYSRRSPGTGSFTGVGREIVLLHESGAAVWAVVEQRLPTNKRWHELHPGEVPPVVWRNMLFRRLPECSARASELIRAATEATYSLWVWRYGSLPASRLRTEVDVTRVPSGHNPGYCYKVAGWTPGPVKRGKLHLYAPEAPR